MPVLSLYMFERDRISLAGPFLAGHASHPSEASTFRSVSTFSRYHATLARARPDDELVLDLREIFNRDNVHAMIDDHLPDGASRRGSIKTSYLRWGDRPEQLQRVGRGIDADELVARVIIDLHVNTPALCPAVDVELTYYVHFFLGREGRVSADVLGAHLHATGGGACLNAVVERVQAVATPGVTQLQQLLNVGVPTLTGGRTFRDLYYLPGRGERTNGSHEGDADISVSVGLVPR